MVKQLHQKSYRRWCDGNDEEDNEELWRPAVWWDVYQREKSAGTNKCNWSGGMFYQLIWKIKFCLEISAFPSKRKLTISEVQIVSTYEWSEDLGSHYEFSERLKNIKILLWSYKVKLGAAGGFVSKRLSYIWESGRKCKYLLLVLINLVRNS